MMSDQLPSKERIKAILTEWRRYGLSDEWLTNRLVDVAQDENKLAGCQCKGHPTNCYNHPHDCGCTAQPPGDGQG